MLEFDNAATERVLVKYRSVYGCIVEFEFKSREEARLKLFKLNRL